LKVQEDQGLAKAAWEHSYENERARHFARIYPVRPVGKIRVKTCHIAISYDL
jgi:hypothetical protein